MYVFLAGVTFVSVVPVRLSVSAAVDGYVPSIFCLKCLTVYGVSVRASQCAYKLTVPAVFIIVSALTSVPPVVSVNHPKKLYPGSDAVGNVP